MSDIEEAIRRRAYELWEHAGSPESRSDEFNLVAVTGPDGLIYAIGGDNTMGFVDNVEAYAVDAAAGARVVRPTDGEISWDAYL